MKEIVNGNWFPQFNRSSCIPWIEIDKQGERSTFVDVLASDMNFHIGLVSDVWKSSKSPFGPL
jgi:hypothetical protein